MSAIVLIDTSIYLNILDVPGRNQQRQQVFDDFEQRVRASDWFLLPMAAIWETGNHISRLDSGGQRRSWAIRFVDDVCAAIAGDAPYQPTYFAERDEFASWLRGFPDTAQRNKSPTKTNEGISLSDHSIIQEWERTRQRHPLSRVMIWANDSDLSSYDTGAT